MSGDGQNEKEHPGSSGADEDADREPLGEASEELHPGEETEARKLTAVRTEVVYAAVFTEGESELARPTAALAYSGLAAGLSMGFSLIAEGLLRYYLPEARWSPLIEKLGYSVGFLIVILGRQQLFTENTLTVILPLLRKPSLERLLNVARLWATVLVANLLGAFLFAWVLASSRLFSDDRMKAFLAVSSSAFETLPDFWMTALRAVFAGWLIALMVWLLPYSKSERVPVILIITYMIGLGGFGHIIAGSVKVFYLLNSGVVDIRQTVLGFMIPVFLGNIVGGVTLVAALAHAQVLGHRREEDRKRASKESGRR